MSKLTQIRSPEEFTELWENFLSTGSAPTYTLDSCQLQGYITALALGPGAPSELEWLPLVFGGEIPKYLKGIEELKMAVSWLFNDQLGRFGNGALYLPFEPQFHSEREERVPSEQWARGFMQGYIYWQNIWSEISDQTQTNGDQAAILHLGVLDEIDDILATISAIADAEYAISMGKTVEDLYKLYEELPRVVVNYGRVCQGIRNLHQAVTGKSLH